MYCSSLLCHTPGHAHCVGTAIGKPPSVTAGQRGPALHVKLAETPRFTGQIQTGSKRLEERRRAFNTDMTSWPGATGSSACWRIAQGAKEKHPPLPATVTRLRSSTEGPGHPWHARQQHAPWYPWAEISPKKPSLLNPRPQSPLRAAQEVDFQVFNIQPDAQQSGWEAVGQRDKISLCHRYREQSFIPM